MEKIVAVFGGTFSPIHIEHEKIVKQTLVQLNPQKLLIVPTKITPHKLDSDMLTVEHRLNMLQLAFNDMPNVEISRVEIDEDSVQYTYKTLQYFKEKYKDYRLFYVIGQDSLDNFDLWKYPKKICQLAELFVIQRQGVNSDINLSINKAQKKWGAKITLSKYIGRQISSTDLYTYMQFGYDTSDFLSDKVRDYIQRNGIFCEFMEMADRAKQYLNDRRIVHTFNVCLYAVTLAKNNKTSRKSAFIAALLHDVGKYKDIDYGVNLGIDRMFLQKQQKAIQHQFISAKMAEVLFKVTDVDILNAIRFHSTGRAGMSILEKIIYIADTCEKGRAYDGVDAARQEVERDLNRGVIFCLRQNMQFIKRDGKTLSDLSLKALEYEINNLG